MRNHRLGPALIAIVAIMLMLSCYGPIPTLAMTAFIILASVVIQRQKAERKRALRKFDV